MSITSAPAITISIHHITRHIRQDGRRYAHVTPPPESIMLFKSARQVFMVAGSLLVTRWRRFLPRQAVFMLFRRVDYIWRRGYYCYALFIARHRALLTRHLSRRFDHNMPACHAFRLLPRHIDDTVTAAHVTEIFHCLCYTLPPSSRTAIFQLLRHTSRHDCLIR